MPERPNDRHHTQRQRAGEIARDHQAAAVQPVRERARHQPQRHHRRIARGGDEPGIQRRTRLQQDQPRQREAGHLIAEERGRLARPDRRERRDSPEGRALIDVGHVARWLARSFADRHAEPSAGNLAPHHLRPHRPERLVAREQLTGHRGRPARGREGDGVGLGAGSRSGLKRPAAGRVRREGTT